ncbi:MAG: UPF0149 family protein [Dokdonella sp.]
MPSEPPNLADLPQAETTAADGTGSDLTHSNLNRALRDVRLGIDASELHGSLIGYLCGGGSTATDWLSALQIDHEDATLTQHPLLARLHAHCLDQLADLQFGFAPLLPDDGEPLRVRADALIEWSRGFLGGIGLADAVNQIDQLSGDAAEVLPDIARIAAARPEYGDGEEDEKALAEVLEFVRVGVLLLHEELVALPPPATARLH